MAASGYWAGLAVELACPGAWGAVAFMCSDALLGINRFVTPLPLSPVWVLSTYYLAQALIIFNVLTPPPAGAQPPNRSALLPGGTNPR